MITIQISLLLSIISVIKHPDGQFDFAEAEIKMNESWAHISEIYHTDKKFTEY